MLKYLDNHSGERSEKDTFKIHKLLLPTMIEEKEDTNVEKLSKQEKEAVVPVRRLV